MKCPRCNGTRLDPEVENYPCRRCDGHGEFDAFSELRQALGRVDETMRMIRAEADECADVVTAHRALQKIERSPLESVQAATAMIGALAGEHAAIDLGVHERESFESLTRALSARVRISIYDDADRAIRRHAIETAEARFSKVAIVWRLYRDELTPEENARLDLAQESREHFAKSTSYSRASTEAA